MDSFTNNVYEIMQYICDLIVSEIDNLKIEKGTWNKRSYNEMLYSLDELENIIATM